MGRRDEPKLDELQRLLRRLEYMEVEKTPKGTAAPAQKAQSDSAAQNSGYVGALRGGPVVAGDVPSGHADDEPDLDADYLLAASGGQRSKQRSSTAPVVIGATTAAVVSSMVVVGLLLFTQGSDKSGGERDRQAGPERLNFIAPPDADAKSSLAAGDTRTLLQRADEQIRAGQLADARVLLEQAAKLGSGVAALTLGAMYDPTRVAEFGNLGVQADPTLARAWYERARALGEVEASNRLAELARK